MRREKTGRWNVECPVGHGGVGRETPDCFSIRDENGVPSRQQAGAAVPESLERTQRLNLATFGSRHGAYDEAILAAAQHPHPAVVVPGKGLNTFVTWNLREPESGECFNFSVL
jgi:hypothetical protein